MIRKTRKTEALAGPSINDAPNYLQQRGKSNLGMTNCGVFSELGKQQALAALSDRDVTRLL